MMGINFPVNMNIVVISCAACDGTGKCERHGDGKCYECGGSGSRVVSSDNLRAITDKEAGQ